MMLSPKKLTIDSPSVGDGKDFVVVGFGPFPKERVLRMSAGVSEPSPFLEDPFITISSDDSSIGTINFFKHRNLAVKEPFLVFFRQASLCHEVESGSHNPESFFVFTKNMNTL